MASWCGSPSSPQASSPGAFQPMFIAAPSQWERRYVFYYTDPQSMLNAINPLDQANYCGRRANIWTMEGGPCIYCALNALNEEGERLRLLNAALDADSEEDDAPASNTRGRGALRNDIRSQLREEAAPATAAPEVAPPQWHTVTTWFSDTGEEI